MGLATRNIYSLALFGLLGIAAAFPVEELNGNEPLVAVPIKSALESNSMINDKSHIVRRVARSTGFGSDDNEIMETANNMVFMPIYSYQRSTGERRRIYDSSPYRYRTYFRRPSYSERDFFPVVL